MLLQKVAQLEEALSQKDKFIHSSRMIVKFREDHISRLEKKLKEGQGSLTNNESQSVMDQLKEEIKILRDQVQNHRALLNPLLSAADISVMCSYTASMEDFQLVQMLPFYTTENLS